MKVTLSSKAAKVWSPSTCRRRGKTRQGSGEPTGEPRSHQKGATAEESVAGFEPAAPKRLPWTTAAAEEKEEENWAVRPW